jgi:hypothetical protein
MKASLERVVTLLAASGLSDRAIFEGLKEVETYGARAIADLARALRYEIEIKLVPSISEELDAPKLTFEDKPAHVDLRVTNLLRETKLPSTIIADKLSSSISSDAALNTSELPPFRPREGLRSWISRLLQSIPPSQLLHHATKVRNDLIHQNPSDWPLRTRDR